LICRGQGESVFDVGLQIQWRRSSCIELGVVPLGSTAQSSTSDASANTIVIGEIEKKENVV
jgi:hypothetical protein